MKPKGRRLIGPCKHSVDSELKDPNLIYRALQLEDVFVEHDYDVVMEHPELYEFGRYKPQAERGEYASWLNERFGREYTDNLFFLRKSRRKQEIGSEFRELYSQVIKDRAQVPIFYNIWKQLWPLRKTSQPNPRKDKIDDRFFLLQGGLGTGKTTMLRYFAEHVFDHALAIDFPKLRPCVLFVDFQVGYSPAEAITRSEIYKRLKREIIKIFPDLKTEDGLTLISRKELSDQEGFIAIREKERRRIILKARADTVFVQRALSYLASNNYVVVVVFDNCDCYSHKNQLNIFGYLNRLLTEVSEAFGIISLREYTLNELGLLRGMKAFYDLKTIHMTTASVRGMLKRRFEYASDLLDLGQPPELELPELAPGFKVTMTSYREFLNKWRRCLLDKTTIHWMKDMANDNLCDVMRIVRAIVCSANIDVTRIISDYYENVKLYNRKKRGEPWTKKVSTEEFLRLLMLGNIHELTSTIYKDTEETLVQNIFDFNNEMPKGFDSLSGRFPLLIKYHAMLYFGSAKWRSKNVFLKRFSIYGYSKDELLELLKWFIDLYFVESKEGTDVSKIKEISATRKLGFYLHKLTKFIIYQENVRNDVYLTYANTAHYYDTELTKDVHELYYFYRQIMRYECQEYAYMKEHQQQGFVVKYASIVGQQPICWRLLKACRKRITQLWIPISKKSDFEKKRLVDEFNSLRLEILERCQNDELLPKMSVEVRDRCKPLRVELFDALSRLKRRKSQHYAKS